MVKGLVSGCLVLLMGLLMVALVPVAHGAAPQGEVSYTLKWEGPSARENGAPLSLDEISHYELFWSDSSGQSGEIRIDGGSSDRYTHTRNLPLSVEPITTTYRLIAVDLWELKSDFSNEAAVTSIVAPASPPGAPSIASYVHTCNQCTLIVQGATVELGQ